jgi:hypothetical protein
MCSRPGGHLWYSETFPVRQSHIVLDWTVCCKGDPVPGTGGWHFTSHAVNRILDMALDPEDVKALLDRPEVIQPGGTGYPSTHQLGARKKIAMVVVPHDRIVVTCLWRGRDYVRGTDSEPFRDDN